jgi:hypothetical protein
MKPLPEVTFARSDKKSSKKRKILQKSSLYSRNSKTIKSCRRIPNHFFIGEFFYKNAKNCTYDQYLRFFSFSASALSFWQKTYQKG